MIVITTLSVSGKQVPLPVLVRYNVTDPDVISEGEGVYCALSDVFEGTNVPFPPDHIPPEATVTDPFSVTVELFAQAVIALPASTVGAGV